MQHQERSAAGRDSVTTENDTIQESERQIHFGMISTGELYFHRGMQDVPTGTHGQDENMVKYFMQHIQSLTDL